MGSGRGFSKFESDTDRLTKDSSGVVENDGRSIAMTGREASLARDDVRSRSFCIDLRTEPKPAKGLLEEELGDATAVMEELGVEFLLDPKGNSERRLRKAGIPEPAWLGLLAEAGLGENPIPCCGIWLVKTGMLDVDCLREEF